MAELTKRIEVKVELDNETKQLLRAIRDALIATSEDLVPTTDTSWITGGYPID